MPDPAENGVIIVGAGPVGLGLALALGREGIRSHVLERRTLPSPHPRAHVASAPTLEIFRRWGVADAVQARGLPPDQAKGFGWVTTIAGPDIGWVEYLDDAAAERVSPERMCSCPQDLIEPELLAVALKHGATVSWGTEVIGFEQDSNSATVIARDESGASVRLSAPYVVAADGARSRMRSMAGVGVLSETPITHRFNMVFRADLRALVRGRPYILWNTPVLDRRDGVFINLDGIDRWVYSIEFDPTREDPKTFTPEQCLGWIRGGVGDDSVAIELVSTMSWAVDMAVADRFRVGRLMLAGDAAHRFPPSGGNGMNSGIGDANNLAWKLAAVLRHEAHPDLLDSYEDERKPVAELNARQSMENADRLKRARDMADAEPPPPDGASSHARLDAVLKGLRGSLHATGQIFGYVYRSAAIVDDGSVAPVSTMTVYHPCASPGARAPHVRLRARDGRQVSTIALFDNRWVVLAGAAGEAWIEAVRALMSEGPTALAAYRIGPGGDFNDVEAEPGGRWAELYGVSPQGAVLVRPDGHVAYRSADGVPDATKALREAMAQILRGHAPATQARAMASG